MRPNVDPAEIAKFSASAAYWWDLNGDLKTLHQINPLRLDYIHRGAHLPGKTVIDIGCGGGILTESMAAAEAIVTGVDMSEATLNVAKLHQLESGAKIEYLLTSGEEIASQRPSQYDIVTCLEMLEHVPDPKAVIQACATLVKPNGDVFFSTLNRNVKSYFFAIVAAEYVLKLLPRNTHDYGKFIRPSELDEWSRKAGLKLQGMVGIHYNPFTKQFSLHPNVSVNYLAHFKKI